VPGRRAGRRTPPVPPARSCGADSARPARRQRASASGERSSRSPASTASPSVPAPAPYSTSVNRSGRPSRCQASSSWRASAAPKIGWSSGAVKVVAGAGRAHLRARVVAAVRMTSAERHEARRTGSDRARRSPRGWRPRRGCSRQPQRRHRARRVRRSGRPGHACHARSAWRSRRRGREESIPGPTSVCPPPRTGIGAS